LSKPAIALFIAAILLVGAVRFALSVSGVPDATVKYVSMSAVIIVGMVYFALTCKTWKERMKAAYLLILPYMLVEGAALGYTVATGNRTIFHAAEYSFGMTPFWHFIGHLVGGVTWEPLGVFVVMQVIGFVASRALSFRQN
jgi:hypothetical protein